MRISDILSARNLDRRKSYPPQNLKEPETEPRFPSTSPAAERPGTQTFPQILAESARSPYQEVHHGGQARQTDRPVPLHARIRPTEIYSNLIRISRETISGLSASPARFPDLEELCEIVGWVIEGVEFQPARLLEFVERSTPEDYLVGHTANVTILSVALSQQLNWSLPVQRCVGVGALLHDAGMALHKPLYLKTTALTAEEKQAIRRFPIEGAEILKPFLESMAPEPQELVRKIILQSKERISGKGYPNLLLGDQISAEAQVVGLCSTYEAMTHPRAYRTRKLPHETLRQLIELSGETFDGGMIKKLWETLSLFPPGSFVRLNTGEIGKVIDLNRKLPTRPVVKVMVTGAGEKVKEEKIIDLAKVPAAVIEKAVDEVALKLSDRRLLLELRAQKWWFW